ncbi:MAG: phenylalanine--tRNA ligase subunit beta, partial [Gemmatimonadota bacterium]
RPARAASLLGTEALGAAECRRILELLGCRVEERRETLVVRVPSFRPDLSREADLIEEVGRVHGYDRIPPRPRLAGPLPAGPTAPQAAAALLRSRLAALGADEAVTSSIVERRWLDDFGDPARQPWLLANPPTEAQDRLRTTLIPSLLDAARRNFNQRAEGVCLYELGKCFYTSPAGARVEELALGAVWAGARTDSPWRRERAEVDFLDLKGLAESLLGDLDPRFGPAEHPLMRPGYAAAVALGENTVGHLGELAAAIREAFDLASPVYILELDFAPLAEAWSRRGRAFRPLPKFPPIERDLAVVLGDAVRAADVVARIRAVEPRLIEAAELFDTYKGSQLGGGEKSLAFSLRLRSPDRTLEDSQADEVISRVVAALAEAFGARLR